MSRNKKRHNNLRLHPENNITQIRVQPEFSTHIEVKTMDEKKTITLKYPIKIKADSGNMIETNKLFIGRLKTKHLKLLPDDMEGAGNMGRAKMVMPLIAAICGIDESTVGEIDLEDLDNICKELDGFFGKSPEIGKN
jgi:hypothetical protein